MTNGEAVVIDVIDQHLDRSMECHTLFVESDDGFFGTVERQSGTLCPGTKLGDVVEAEHHVLRRYGDRCAIGRIEDVVALQHEHLRLEDGFVGEGKVDGHLVAIEVGVEGRTSEGVELDGFTFNHLGLESLDGETVERRSTVEEDGVSLHDEFEDVPNHGFAAIHDFLSALHRFHDAAFDEFADDERLVELGSHEFGQTTLAHLQFRADNDDRTSGIVDTLTEEVLTEASLLTLQRVGERLEGTVAFALHRARLTAVVEEAVHGFLKHTLLVAEDDLGSFDFKQTLEAVVANEDTTIEVIKVGSGKTATIEGYERTQLRRSDGNDFHNHPLGLVAFFRSTERLYHLQAFERFALTSHGAIGIGTVAQFVGEAVEIDALEEIEDSFGPHLSDKLVGVGILEILVFFGELLELLVVFVFGEQVVDGQFITEHTGLNHDITLVVDDHVELLGGNAQQVAHLVGQRTEVPNVRHRHHQGDVSGTFATHLLFGHFHTATVADDALVADTLVFSAVALIVLGRTKDALAEETVTLGLVGTIVDRLGLQHFTIGVGLNFFGRCQTDGDFCEIGFYLSVCFESHNLLVYCV